MDSAAALAIASQVDSQDSKRWIAIVDVVILSLTLLGATSILLSMFLLEVVRGRPATTRTRIVQALIFSDFILGIVGLLGTTLTLADPTLMMHGTSNCSGLGFMFVITLWTEHLWTLILAFATFMILIYPLHIITMWLEKRWYFLWAAVWLVAMAVAIVGLEVYGYYPADGACYYGSNAGLYSELIQFIPRALVCTCITILYARLYVFLRRPDKIRIPGSNSFTNATQETLSSDTTARRRTSRFGSWVPAAFRRPTITAAPGTEGVEKNEADKIIMASVKPPATRRESLDNPHSPHDENAMPMASGSGGELTTSNGPAPWEQLELPPFQINGERFGGGHHTSGSSSNHLWGGWKGLGTKKRPSTATTINSTTTVSSPRSRSAARMNSSSSSSVTGVAAGAGAGGIAGGSGSIRTISPSFGSGPTTGRLSLSHNISLLHPPRGLQSIPSGDERDFTTFEARTMADYGLGSGAGLSNELSRSERIAGMSIVLPERGRGTGDITPPYDQVSPLCTPPARSITSIREGKGEREREMRRRSSAFAFETQTQTQTQTQTHSRQSSGPQLIKDRDRDRDHEMKSLQQHSLSSTPTPIPLSNGLESRNNSVSMSEAGQRRQSDEDEGEDEDDEAGEGDGEWDLMKMLAHVPPGTTDDRFAPPQGNDGETFEFVPESMASYLNRKTALLMLWFPLGYVFLFSVSLVRLIYDFVGRPPTGLRAVSRWMVLSQGLLDALIYGLVEWHTKRVVRRKVRRGTLSPRQTANSNHNGNGYTNSQPGIGSKLGMGGTFRNFGFGSKTSNGGGVSGGRVLSPYQSHNGTGVGMTSIISASASNGGGKRGSNSAAGGGFGMTSIQDELERERENGSDSRRNSIDLLNTNTSRSTTPRNSIIDTKTKTTDQNQNQNQQQQQKKGKPKQVFVVAPGDSDGDQDL